MSMMRLTNSVTMNAKHDIYSRNTYRLFAFDEEGADISWTHGKWGASLRQRDELWQLIKSSVEINCLQHPDRNRRNVI